MSCTVRWVVLVLAACTVTVVVVVTGQQPCPTITGYRTALECVFSFTEYWNSNTFTLSLCSDGRAIVKCLQAYGDVCPDIWDTQIEKPLNLSYFQENLANINVSCELWNNEQCTAAQDCFLSVFGESSTLKTFHEGLAEFYGFFCGGGYFRKTEACISSARSSCPFTVADLEAQTLTIRSNGSVIKYSQMKDTVNQYCGTSLAYQTTSTCLTTNAKLLQGCTKPEINMKDRLIQCNFHVDTETCIEDRCGQVASNFFKQMSEFLQCGDALMSCQKETDNNGNAWPTTLKETVYTLECLPLEEGAITRLCQLSGVWGIPVSTCKPSVTLDTIQEDLDTLLNGGGSPELFTEVLENLTKITDVTTNPIQTKEDLTKAINITDSIVNLTEDEKVKPTEEDTGNFLLFFNNLVSPVNIKPWRVLILDGLGVEEMLRRVSDFLAQVQKDLCNSSVSEIQQNFTFPHIYSQVIKTQAPVYVLPDRTKDQAPWLLRSETEISIQSSAFPDQQFLCIGASYIRDVSEIVAPKAVINGTVVNSEGVKDINSAILALRLTGPVSTKIDPPVRLVFTLLKETYTEPVCSFWDYDATGASTQGAWSSRGCTVVSFNSTQVICECDHLTNFCVLMKPTDLSKTKVLNIISAVGCAISIVALLLTVFLYWFVWRLVRSDRAVILMNLCIALLLALVIFLAGVDKTQSKAACTAIAAMLHFLFLVVFCLMLVEGIEIFVCVVHVFVTRFRIKYFVPVAWIVPAVIVAVSLGVTKTEGYGSPTYCWLSIDNYLIYAFIGPVAFIILLNLLVIITVFWKMSRSAILKSKPAVLKAKTSLRSLCVLLPVLGLTWAFGLLAIISDDLIVFQYIFAIVNSLQGLLIFVFHCIFNRQIRDALRSKNARRKSRETFENSRNKSLPRLHEKRQSDSISDGYMNQQKTGTDSSHDNSFDSGGQSQPRQLLSGRGRRGGLPAIPQTDPIDWQAEEREQYHKQHRSQRN